MVVKHEMTSQIGVLLSLMCHVHFLALRPPRATQTLKQHMAGIEVSDLFDLKKIMLSLPLMSADIISRRFVN